MLCSYRALVALPSLVAVNGSSRWSLSIDSNNITSIPGGSLPPNLTNIDMSDNPVATIDDNAFEESTTTLSSLYFSYVRFTRFPDAFRHLLALNSLSITSANIRVWNDDAWVNIGGTLQTLQLNNVGITAWPGWSGHLKQLENLVIANCYFSSIPDGALDSVAKSLESLSLNNNRLTMVPKALSNLNSLQILFLQNNHIADLRWLPQNSKLNMLSLSYNYIWNASQLSEVLRPYNHSLYSFDIDNNHLASIPDIPYLNNVPALELTHNRISDSVSGSLSSNVIILGLSYNSFPFVPNILFNMLPINDINLSYNAISAIRDTDFHKSITSIDLRYNLITHLTDTSFPENFGLLDLLLNNNPLSMISSVTLQNLPSLKYLSLQHTQITRLPVGLAYLRSLYTIDVSDNTHLVCTCAESSLAGWVTKMDPMMVLGGCGQTSVYEFFSQLSPSCPTSGDTVSSQSS
ncbi:hypothetical protein BsWGS_23104 [Bradybaena similaris]